MKAHWPQPPLATATQIRRAAGVSATEERRILKTLADAGVDFAKPKVNARKCPKCKVGGFERLHSCPFQADIAGNNEKHCNCCGQCQNECVADI